MCICTHLKMPVGNHMRIRPCATERQPAKYIENNSDDTHLNDKNNACAIFVSARINMIFRMHDAPAVLGTRLIHIQIRVERVALECILAFVMYAECSKLPGTRMENPWPFFSQTKASTLTLLLHAAMKRSHCTIKNSFCCSGLYKSPLRLRTRRKNIKWFPMWKSAMLCESSPTKDNI